MFFCVVFFCFFAKLWWVVKLSDIAKYAEILSILFIYLSTGVFTRPVVDTCDDAGKMFNEKFLLGSYVNEKLTIF